MNMAYYQPRHTMQGGDDLSNLFFGAVSVLFVAAVVFGLVVLIGRYAEGRGWIGDVDTDSDKQQLEPLAIAKERYAKGEITKVEFEQLKKDLA